MQKKNKLEGSDAFNDFYGNIYGERWPGLVRALAGQGSPVDISLLPEGGFTTKTPPEREIESAENVENPEGAQKNAGGRGAYRMDAASIRAACALVMPESGSILDACAAPGGKTLVLASRMPPGANLVANELSADRRRRLRLVMQEYLPEILRSRVHVTSMDAAIMCRKQPGVFGAILLDAPCSSERHVLGNPVHLARWTQARTKNLAFRQWALLSSAFVMLAAGGCLVYSTCSISPEENDGVIERLLKKNGGSLVLDPPVDEGAETTAHGVMHMPDRMDGAGPMYICRIFKNKN